MFAVVCSGPPPAEDDANEREGEDEPLTEEQIVYAVSIARENRRLRVVGLDGTGCALAEDAAAALGGVLADKYGYASTFLVTAGVQAAGTLVQCFLLPLVPRKDS